MGVHFSTELCYPFEAANLLARFVDQSELASERRFESIAHYKADFSAEHHVPPETLDRLFAPLQEVFDHVEQNLDISPETLADYFGQRHFPFLSYGSCVAFLNITSPPLAGLDSEKRFSILCDAVLEIFLQDQAVLGEARPPCRSEAVLFDRIASAEISDAAKLYLLRFYHHAEELQAEITGILDRAAALMREKESLYLPWLQDFIAGKKSAIEEFGLDYLGKTYRIEVKAEERELYISPSLTRFEAVGIDELELWNGSESLNYRIGCLVDELDALSKAQAGDMETLAKKIRALDDKRRLDILRELRRRPLCGQEIAELTGLTAGTVSHHMNALIHADFVDLRKDGVRIQYTLSPQGVQAFLQELRGALLD